jgi:hypothetical protein
MTYQAYLDNIRAKTGKTPDDFRALAAQRGLTNYGEIMAWLKTDFDLGHGHANTIAHLIVHPEARNVRPDERLAKLFAGKKEKWRKPYDALVTELAGFGSDVREAPTNSYISLLRGSNKFGIVQPSSVERLDIGIKLKGAEPTGKFEPAGSWQLMVTHRVRITEPAQIDKEVLAWLRKAYDAA